MASGRTIVIAETSDSEYIYSEQPPLSVPDITTYSFTHRYNVNEMRSVLIVILEKVVRLLKRIFSIIPRTDLELRMP